MFKACKNGCSYALKTFLSEEDVTNAEMQRQLFRHEAELLTSIDHPRIPKCREIFTYAHHEYMVQEYIKGEPLSSLLLRGYVFSEREIIRLLTQLLEILCFLHNQRIVHRDLRLGNLLLSHDQLYLIDFGLARKFPLTNCSDVLPEPIPRNSSPDYLALRREISPASDIFGTGMVAIDLMGNWFGEEPPDFSRKYPISAGFAIFLRKLLKPAGGFSTTSAALEYLRKLPAQ